MRKSVVTLAMLSAMLLTGCGDDGNVSQITIDKEGGVKSYIVEDFTFSYYDADELQAKVLSDITDLNEEHGKDVIKLTDFAYEQGIVKATVEYSGTDIYEEFNEETMFCGTPAEAISQKYDENTVLYDVNDMEKTVSLKKLEDKECQILIFTEPVNMKLSQKVLYVSEGLTKGNSSKKVSITDDKQEIYYIIYE